jgi:Chaperone for flagella basal body P-ring formation
MINMHHRVIAAILLLGTLCVAETATAPAAPTPEARVLAALNSANIRAQHGKLQFLAPLNLNNATAAFKIIGVEKWQDASAMARVRCVNSADCIPFFVMLRWPSPEERDAALQAPVLVKEQVKGRTTKDVLVHAGEQASLVLENKKFRIVEPVTCLENGTQGQMIRVRSADKKKIRVVEVEQAGLLKGSL